MAKRINPLVDNTVDKQVTLRLPPLNFEYMSTPKGVLTSDKVQEFCALHEKLRRNTFMWEGIVRIDFDTTSVRRAVWEYGLRIATDDRTLPPLCLVLLPSLSGTKCGLENRSGRQTLVVTTPHIALYAKSERCREPGGPLPVPHLPAAARNGYKAISSGDVQEVAISLKDGAIAIAKCPGFL